jgi:hypothetical protein
LIITSGTLLYQVAKGAIRHHREIAAAYINGELIRGQWEKKKSVEINLYMLGLQLDYDINANFESWLLVEVEKAGYTAEVKGRGSARKLEITFPA